MELYPAPFSALVARVFREHEVQQAIFDLPVRNWFAPADGAPDLGVSFHGRPAGNPVGPASGPQTQMAQNLLLSYLGGSRIMELKTVQVNDRLTIPRPCIDMTTVGYNVEWSQELRVEDSLREYVAGMMLVEIFRQAHPACPATLREAAGETIYDISLGYDLAGVQSDKVQAFLDGMRDAGGLIEKLRAEIPVEYAAARNASFPTQISNTLTLSTFHGCPTDEIEKMCEFLMAERSLDVIVKMNPPTLGRDELEYLLNDLMGYDEIRVHPGAYSASQSFIEAVEMCRRLRDFGRARGRSFGCKFSNTLEVANHRSFFTPENQVMCLSGPPLHVITLTLAVKFREVIGPDLPVSFSAGVDQHNFAACAACGFTPITTCSDLLKPGGYGRLPNYLHNLSKALQKCGAANLDEFILNCNGHADATLAERPAREQTRFDASLWRQEKYSAREWAMLLNARDAVARAQADPRYRKEKNSREPKRIDSHLQILDCIICNKCVPVCPNDANFVYPTPLVEFEIRDLLVAPDGSHREDAPRTFKIEKENQIANYAEFCNECGNCDTFCPEYGGPYIEKPSFYLSRVSYEAARPRDGFLLERNGAGGAIRGRIRGAEYALTNVENCPAHVFNDGVVEAVFESSEHRLQSIRLLRGLTAEHRLDLGIYHTLHFLRDGVLETRHVNQLNAEH